MIILLSRDCFIAITSTSGISKGMFICAGVEIGMTFSLFVKCLSFYFIPTYGCIPWIPKEPHYFHNTREWLEAIAVNFLGREPVDDRYGFEGNEASFDFQKLYVGKRTLDDYRKRGTLTSIKYTW